MIAKGLYLNRGTLLTGRASGNINYIDDTDGSFDHSAVDILLLYSFIWKISGESH
jgi:hypothetical protein